MCERGWREAVAHNKRLIPVLRRDVDVAGVPPMLQAPNWVLLRERDDAEEGLTRLLEALEGDLEWRDAHARLTVRAGEWRAGERDKGFLLHGADTDPQLGLLLAREAIGIRPTAQATAALRRSLGASLLTGTIALPGDPVARPWSAATARYVLQAFRDRVARVWDLRSRTLVATLRGHRDLRPSSLEVEQINFLRAAFSPDGRLAATSGDDGLVRLWDWRRARVLETWRSGNGSAIAFSPGGGELAAAPG